MGLLNRLAVLAVALAVSACGGGGAATGTTSSTGTGSGTSPVASATVSVAVSSSNITTSSPVNVAATVRGVSGAVVAGQLVTFSTSGTLVSIVPASAVTDASGVATVVARAATTTVGGAEEILASATLAASTTAITGKSAVTVTVENPSVTVSLSGSTITSSQPATVRAVVKDFKGVPVAGAIVTFATNLGLGSFDATTAVTDASGLASVVLSPRTATTTGADTLTAAATVNAVTQTASAVVQFATSIATGLPTISLSLSSTSVSSATPAIATAAVLDAKGLPVAGRVVDFKSSRGLGTVNVASALTNASGLASVSLTPASSTTAGADDLIASTTIAGSAIQASQGFQAQASAVTITSFTSTTGAGTLSAYGQTSLTVKLIGAAVGSPVNVSLTSSCLALGKATLSPVSFTATTDSTVVQYKDNGCGALQSGDRLQAAIAGASTSPISLDLAIASPAVNSIAFVGASPQVIFLKGSGLGEVSQVTFELRDSAGNALPNQTVTTSLSTFTGGLTIDGGIVPVSSLTNAAGQVTVRVNSGSVPTPVRVVATVGTSGIQTVSSALSVAVGLPSQLNFSLSQQTRNIEGFDIDGTPNTYNIIAADRSGNPVPDGTSINFVTEGGQVQAIRQTALANGIARTSANFVSSSPRPDDGRITVVAYALGEESFLDLNGNNAYDANEPFQDLGDIFKDRNFDGVYDPLLDEFVSLDIAGKTTCVVSAATSYSYALLRLDASIPSVPASCDGAWGRAYVRRAIETVLSTSVADPVWFSGAAPPVSGSAVNLRTDAGTTTTTFQRVSGSSITGAGMTGALGFLARDRNPIRLNPVAAGSTVTVTATTGLTVIITGGSPVPSTLEANGVGLSYEFTAPTTSGTLTINVTSPSGVVSSLSLRISAL